MELTQERVNREIARIAFFDPRMRFAADGRPRQVIDLDDDTAACITGIDVLEEDEGSGENRVLVGHVKKYKVANKNTALEKAANILRMFEKEADELALILQEISGCNSAFLSVLLPSNLEELGRCLKDKHWRIFSRGPLQEHDLG